jgi:hypothetical protein
MSGTRWAPARAMHARLGRVSNGKNTTTRRPVRGKPTATPTARAMRIRPPGRRLLQYEPAVPTPTARALPSQAASSTGYLSAGRCTIASIWAPLPGLCAVSVVTMSRCRAWRVAGVHTGRRARASARGTDRPGGGNPDGSGSLAEVTPRSRLLAIARIYAIRGRLWLRRRYGR